METSLAYETIVQYTRKILTTCKIENVSFVDFNPQNNYTLILLLEKLSNFISSVLVISDKIKSKDDRIDIIKLKEWSKNKETYIDKTKKIFSGLKNKRKGFLFRDCRPLSKEEFSYRRNSTHALSTR